MKKQFFRVKQLADQTFLRADKSEVLNNEELHIADQKIEYLRTAITAINKKISTGYQGVDIEKRAKKTLEYQIGSVFLDQSRGKHDPEQNHPRNDEDCQLFQQILRYAGEVEQDLAKDYAEHEAKVEELVASEFQKVLDNEFPSVSKQKRNLGKYLLDLDSATNRYQSTKKEALRDDMEEADSKVEQSRDALAIEMFNLLARENEFSSYILQLLKLQRGYHESALKNLERLIPELERKIGNSSIKKVFGIPLQEHLRVTGKRLAYPLEICITVLSISGMSEEGILRMAGAMSKVRRLKASIDSGCFTELIPEYKDVHVVASTMKMYLRELPEPLLTYTLHKEWVESMQYPDSSRLEVVMGILSRLPRANYDNLAYLIQFLAKVAQHTENRMSSSNLAIVMAPNLLWDQEEESNMNMSNCATLNMLVEFFIKEVHSLFPEDMSKYCTLQSLAVDDERNTSFGRLDAEQVDLNVSSESIPISDSPKPSTRKKKPAAPVPPNNLSKTDQDIVTNSSKSSSRNVSYPSGSSTLNRPSKSRETATKTSVATNTSENSLSFSRGKTGGDEPTNTHNINVDTNSKTKTLVSTFEENVDHRFVSQPALSANASKVKPVPVQVSEGDKTFKTTAVHQVVTPKFETKPVRPVAAPRSSLTSSDGNPLNRSASMRNEPTNQSLNEPPNKPSNEPYDDVLLRQKPKVPLRPASLPKPSPADSNFDPSLQKTHVYNLANKQQPSIVNLQNKNEKFQPGHDNQITEKEKFLGHQPNKVIPLPRTSLENKFNDINSNPSSDTTCKKPNVEVSSDNKQNRPPRPTTLRTNEFLNNTKTSEKLTMSKSNEKLNESSEVQNGNQRTSHTRTRSDGNIIETAGGEPMLRSIGHTPPSPRTFLSKPTQPPPPPPVIVKNKGPDSTDL